MVESIVSLTEFMLAMGNSMSPVEILCPRTWLIVKNMPYIVDGSSSIIQAIKFLYARKRTLSYAVNKDTIPYQELEISDDAIMAILSMVFGKQNPSDTAEPKPADLGETLYRTSVPEDEDEEV